MKAVALFFSAKIDNFMGESEFLIKILLKLYKFSGGGDFFGSGLFFFTSRFDLFKCSRLLCKKSSVWKEVTKKSVIFRL